MHRNRLDRGATPSLACLAALGIAAAVAAAEPPEVPQPPRVVMLINEDPDNYEAHRTMPRLAEQLCRDHDWQITLPAGEGKNEAYRFTQPLELDSADLLVVFCRRLALPPAQMAAIKAYVQAGKPVVGIRTANHGFSVRGEVAAGFEDWPQFVAEVLGCENRGYGPTAPGTQVSLAPGVTEHPIFRGLATQPWHSSGNVYHTAPLLDPAATVLLHGEVNGQVEPIAWTRSTGSKGRVFYTSLGHPSDFEQPWFRDFLTAAMRWAME